MLKNLKEIFYKRSTCLGDVYRLLERRQPDAYDEVHGGRVKVEVIAETPVPNELDEKSGIKRVLVKCRDDCGKECLVRFNAGGIKTKDADDKFKFGDMKPGKSYSVEGYTFIDRYGSLIITNLS
jgi:hypothetical protein